MTKNENSKIVTLAGEFKNKTELKVYCDSLYNSLSTALEEINKLKTENSHLKNLLQSTVPIIGSASQPISNEELICIKQIELLSKFAQTRELSLDEVKKLDLLNKNLRLIRGQTGNDDRNKEKEAIPIEMKDLIAIASSKESENGKQ